MRLNNSLGWNERAACSCEYLRACRTAGDTAAVYSADKAGARLNNLRFVIRWCQETLLIPIVAIRLRLSCFALLLASQRSELSHTRRVARTHHAHRRLVSRQTVEVCICISRVLQTLSTAHSRMHRLNVGPSHGFAWVMTYHSPKYWIKVPAHESLRCCCVFTGRRRYHNTCSPAAALLKDNLEQYYPHLITDCGQRTERFGDAGWTQIHNGLTTSERWTALASLFLIHTVNSCCIFCDDTHTCGTWCCTSAMLGDPESTQSTPSFSKTFPNVCVIF